ncbi:MAG: PilZ domain-containing protein [Oceanospirillaceae bacterium]|nr:PilZ domain-containing protein [Oceanospirillaceae bacterium]
MQEQERRKFFRIDHQVSIELKTISAEEIAKNPTPVQFEVSPYFLLLSQLQDLDTEGDHLLRKIAEKDANTAAFLQLMHRKIDTIAKAVAVNGIELEQILSQEINLSEGGMMFEYPETFDMDQHLAIKLIFPETCIGLLLYAKVCRLIPMSNGHYKVGIEFIRMPESCRVLLARQVMLLQSHQRRLERQNSEPNFD